MSDLIKVDIKKIGDAEVNSVNLRDVHAFVESKQDFSTWVKNRLNDFTEDVDFTIPQKSGAVITATYGQGRIDYIVSLDTAKHIAMIERNEKGKQLRQYFIDCEKKLLTQNMLPDFNNPAVAARAWATEFEAKQLAIAQLEQAKPKLEAWEQYLSLDGTMLATDFAKSVGLSSAVTLNNFLINKGILCKKTNTKGTHTARAGYEEWFRKVARSYTDIETGEKKTVYQLRISGLGVEKLRGIVQEGFATGELKKSKSK